MAHLGDSLVADDKITGRLRRVLQSRWGNGGVGFQWVVPPSRWNHPAGVTAVGRGWALRSLVGERAAKAPAPMLLGRETKLVGLMGSLALTPNKASRAKFASEAGTVGLRCRERCFANNLVMRHVGDRMIIAPPLVITEAEIDVLIERARKSLDECYAGLKGDDLLKAA